MSNIVALNARAPDQDAAEIGALYRKGRGALVEGVLALLEAGRRLNTKRKNSIHGEWLPWLAANRDVLGFASRMTANRLMDAAKKYSNVSLAIHLDENEALRISREIWDHDKPAPAIPSHDEPDKKTATRGASFIDMPRGAEIAAQFSNRNAAWGVMHFINSPGCRPVWDMMLVCYDAGFLRDSKYYPNGNHDVCSLRLLFPRTPRAYAGRFDLRSERARNYVRDIILPAALAARDKVLADPESLEHVVARAQKPVPPTRRAAPTPTPVDLTPKTESAPATTSLTDHQRWVDPEFTGTQFEFTDKYGHVQTMTAKDYATDRFGNWSSAARELVKAWKRIPDLGRAVDHNWLREPAPRDLARMKEAMDVLRPVIAEMEALIVTAEAALKTKE